MKSLTLISLLFCCFILFICCSGVQFNEKKSVFKSKFTLNNQTGSNRSIAGSVEENTQFQYSYSYTFSEDHYLPVEGAVATAPTTTSESTTATPKIIDETTNNKKSNIKEEINSRDKNILLQSQESFTSPIKFTLNYNEKGNEQQYFKLPNLDFKNVGLCTKSNLNINFDNPGEESIQILSILSFSEYFSSSIINSFELKPGDTKTAEISFQPKEIGSFESSILINTNLGEFSFNVKGNGVESLYRLSTVSQKIIERKQKEEQDHSEIIHPLIIYNPHNTTLKLYQIFTQENSPFYLTLPTQQQKNYRTIGNNLHLWEIKPYESVNFIDLFFKTKSEIGLYSGSINIVSNFEEFVIGVEISIIKNDKTIEFNLDEIDYGYLNVKRSLESKPVSLSIINSDSLFLTMVENTGSDSKDQKHLLLNDSLIPSHFTFTEIGKFYWSFNESTGVKPSSRFQEYSGVYTLNFRNTKSILDEENYYVTTLSLKWKIRIIYGELEYQSNSRYFHYDTVSSNANDQSIVKPITNSILLKNQFPLPVKIQFLSILDEASQSFEILNSNNTLNEVVYPNQYWSAIQISFRPFSKNLGKLKISSNLTDQIIDLYSFNGKLDFSLKPIEFFDFSATEEEDFLDFGIVGLTESRRKIFTLRNPTPYPLTIQSFQLVNQKKLLPSIKLSLKNIYNDKFEIFENLDESIEFSDLLNESFDKKNSLILKPGYIGRFQIELKSNSNSKNSNDLILKIVTNFTSNSYQLVPIKYLILNGSLTIYPTRLEFGNQMGEFLPIFAENKYNVPVNITLIDSSDSKVICNILEISIPASSEKTKVATLSLDQNEITSPEPLPVNQAIDEFFRREENWLSTSSDNNNNNFHFYSIDSNIKIHTDIGKDFNIKVNGIIKKPELFINDCQSFTNNNNNNKNNNNNNDFKSILTFNHEIEEEEIIHEMVNIKPISSESDDYFMNSHIDFGLVRIGEQSSKYIYIHNPLNSTDIKVEMLPFFTQTWIGKHYQFSNSILESIFRVAKDSDNQNPDTRFPDQLHFENDEQLPHPKRIIKPGESAKIGPIVFAPKGLYNYSWIIYLRNNYTHLSPIKLLGRGGGGKLVMLKESSEEIPSLQFELNKTHLSPCILKKKDEIDLNSEILFDKNQKILPKSQKDSKIEMNKTISIINRGNLPIEILDFHINDIRCHGYGFKVQSCNELRQQSPKLAPGESLKLLITFEPDFTTSLLKRDLIVKTNQPKPFIFNLIGSVPHEYLPLCNHLHPSNFYEYHAKIVFILCMLILFIVLIVITLREFSKHPKPSSTSSSNFNSINHSKNSKVFKFSDRELILDDHHVDSNNTTTPHINTLGKSPDKSLLPPNKDSNISSTKKKKSSSPILSRINNTNNTNNISQNNCLPNNINESNNIEEQKKLTTLDDQKKIEKIPNSILKKKVDDSNNLPKDTKNVVFYDEIKFNIQPSSSQPSKKLSINVEKKLPSSTQVANNINLITPSNPTTSLLDSSTVSSPTSSNNLTTNNLTTNNLTTNSSGGVNVNNFKPPAQVKYEKKKYSHHNDSAHHMNSISGSSNSTTPPSTTTTAAPNHHNYKSRYYELQQQSITPKSNKEYKPKKPFEKTKKVYIPKVKDPNIISTTPSNTTINNTIPSATTTPIPTSSTPSSASTTNPLTTSTTTTGSSSSNTINNIINPFSSIQNSIPSLSNSSLDGFTNFFPFFTSSSSSSSNNNSNSGNSSNSISSSFTDFWSNNSSENNIFNSNNSTTTTTTTNNNNIVSNIGVIGSGKSNMSSSTPPLREALNSLSPNPSAPNPTASSTSLLFSSPNASHSSPYFMNLNTGGGSGFDQNPNSSTSQPSSNYFRNFSTSYDLFSNHSLFAPSPAQTTSSSGMVSTSSPVISSTPPFNSFIGGGGTQGVTLQNPQNSKRSQSPNDIFSTKQ